MILRIIALEVLKNHDIDAEKSHLIAVEIEDNYINEISKMFIDRGKAERTISIDPEFLIEQEIRKVEDDFPLRESAHIKPVDVSSPSAGLLKT